MVWDRPLSVSESLCSLHCNTPISCVPTLSSQSQFHTFNPPPSFPPPYPSAPLASNPYDNRTPISVLNKRSAPSPAPWTYLPLSPHCPRFPQNYSLTTTQRRDLMRFLPSRPSSYPRFTPPFPSYAHGHHTLLSQELTYIYTYPSVPNSTAPITLTSLLPITCPIFPAPRICSRRSPFAGLGLLRFSAVLSH